MNDKYYQEIMDTAAEPLNRLFKQEAEAMVRRTLCEGAPCPRLCHRARHNMAIMVESLWEGYARLN